MERAYGDRMRGGFPSAEGRAVGADRGIGAVGRILPGFPGRPIRLSSWHAPLDLEVRGS